jgi:hypothetical protein
VTRAIPALLALVVELQAPQARKVFRVFRAMLVQQARLVPKAFKAFPVLIPQFQGRRATRAFKVFRVTVR